MMSVAPVEYLILGFDRNNFNGQILQALLELVENGTVKILDIVFISKDANGVVTALEFDEVDDLEPFRTLTDEGSRRLNEDDIEIAAMSLDPNSSAAFLVREDLWAAKFAHAVLESRGSIIKGERIPHQIPMEALEFAAQKAKILR